MCDSSASSVSSDSSDSSNSSDSGGCNKMRCVSSSTLLTSMHKASLNIPPLSSDCPSQSFNLGQHGPLPPPGHVFSYLVNASGVQQTPHKRVCSRIIDFTTVLVHCTAACSLQNLGTSCWPMPSMVLKRIP